MIQLELIEFADLIYPKDIVKELIRQIPNIPPPIPLDSIAEAIGIQEINYKQYDGFEGALVADEHKTRGVILVNNSLPGRGGKCRQRYSLGHELGHFMLPLHNHEMTCTMNDIHGKTNKKIEDEADEFSSLLLMPETMFNQESAFSESPSLQKMCELALRYDVSFEACSKRYIKCHSTPAMLIFYKDKKMKYFSQSDFFPFYFATPPKGGLPAPLNSLTSKTGLMAPNSICKSKLASSIWFTEGNKYQLPAELVEEVYVQESGYSITLLSFEKKLKPKKYHTECALTF